MNNAKYRDDLYAIWEQFIAGNGSLKGIRKEVALSWKRSKAAGVDPFGQAPSVDKTAIIKLQEENSFLIKVVSPFINLLSSFIQNTGFLILLVDKNGIVIKLKGDGQALVLAEANNLYEGADRSESKVGTNSICLALIENKPFQIQGSEHFVKCFHNWTCSAAPIHDTAGNIIGVLNLSGHRSLLHKHTLGMVISLVQAIEREFHIREKNEILQLVNERLKAVIDSVSEAIIAIDKNGIIIETNDKFQQLFHLTKSELFNCHITAIFQKPILLLKVLKTGQDYFDREETLSHQAYNISSISTCRKILNEQGETVGAVGIFKEKKDVYHLVNQLSGAKAVFDFEHIIHQDPQMARVISLAQTVAATDTRVLLEGESGTGKELFAQAIHNASPRHTGPFVGVNCSAIPRELIESELFGYSEGSFTGAKKGGKPGKFELADGGTLFLDEVNSMPLDMQVKLLRVLQQNEITRVGGEQPTAINVRIIAAANKNLEQLVKEGRFRLDLFYRIGVVILKIPALRERIKDIPLLFSYLVQKISRSMGKVVEYSLEELAPALCTYDWPGNVRELENYIERAVILAHDGIITTEHLPDNVITGTTAAASDNVSYLAIKEREAIERMLKIFNGNISKTAKSLGVSRNTLYSKIKLYDLASR